MNNSQVSLRKPHQLLDEFPLLPGANAVIRHARQTIANILKGHDKRLLIIVGPCSIHDTQAALEYAELLQAAATRFADELFIVMRVYFEKPRTTVGWKGFINDPFLDGSYDMNSGLRLARKLLLDLNHLGMPAGTEFLDTIIPHYLSDLISWSAVGARTSASQIHRESASGFPFPVGFKNNTDGNIKIAIDAVNVASHPHRFITIDKNGSLVITHTTGNPTCHVILRGSDHGPNYQMNQILHAANSLQEADLMPRLIVDCSHGNSMKNYALQKQVANSVIEQIENGSKIISGVMLESNLVAGKQTLAEQPLVYGQSITDGCLAWTETLDLLERFASATSSRVPSSISYSSV